MALTGISAISGDQSIAAGAVSAKEAGKASFTTGGNDIQNLYDTVSTNSGSWTGGGAATLPVSGSAGENTAVYDLYDMKIEYNLPSIGGSEPEHTYVQAGTNSITVYESYDEDQSNNQTLIGPGYVHFENPEDGPVDFYPSDVNNLLSVYNTVSTESGNWTGGGGELPQSATEAIETVTANSAYWDRAYTAVDSNSGAWSETYGAVNSMSAEWTSAFTSVNMGSGAWDSAWAAIYSPDASANLWNSASTAVMAGSGVWDGTYATVNQNSASWGAGADYSAGKNISIAGDVISTTDTISVTGDVQVENSTETQVTSAPGTIWGTNYYGHYASLNSSYKITVTGTPANLDVYVYDFDHGGYYVSGLTTADLQNFTITGLSSLPNAVTSKQGDWSTTDWFEGAEFGIGDPTFNEELETWPVASTLYVLEGSNISLSGLNDFIETNSASWTASGPSYTGDAQGALDEVYSNSANWDGSYDTLTANSANWTSTRNTVYSRSANWNKVYTTVNDNSAAWGGSALPISAGPGVKMDVVDDTLVFSNDETVLYSSTVNAKTTAFTLSESLTAFEKVRFEITGYTHVHAEDTHQTPSANTEEITTCFTYYAKSTDNNPLQMMMGTYSSTNGLNYGLVRSKFLYMPNSGTTWGGSTEDAPHLQKIVGINRKASN